MRRLICTAIVLALSGAVAQPGFAAGAASATGAKSALPTTQLPRDIRPTRYDVSITPDATRLTFAARTRIGIDVAKPVDAVVLNALDMEFGKVVLVPAGGGAPWQATATTVDAATQTARFEFGKPIPAGSYQLEMDYVGKIGTQANGLFAIDYVTESGPRRALYTQFENSDARRMFPSWDEPAFRTPFTLEATVPAKQMAVSNMPVATRTDLGNGLARVKFQTTPSMSSYLLFLGVGDFERATDFVDGTQVGVVTQSGKLAQGQVALDASKRLLREYNDYFAVPYPLPKLDNVASPGGSAWFGAMENWGAIYTFESAVLVDPAISTETDAHRVFSVAAHEIAHQWFGNLVTMQWWDDLWLNEGFASWMENRTTTKLHPEWNNHLSDVGVREEAMARDAVASTHPVVQHVETVEQANQAFDSITYSKGEAVINMLENYVGADAWRKGVRLYMKQHAYSNTASDDLWRAMEASGSKPITDIAHDFTLQPGVPMIRVGAPRCRDGLTEVSLTQDEFTVDRPTKSALRWRVPVIAESLGSGKPVSTLVSDGKASLALPGCEPVLVNAGQAGYYRTLYSPAHFAAIAGTFNIVASIDQLGLLADSYSLGLAGNQASSDVLELVVATPLDADTQVWGRIATILSGLDDYYAPGTAQKATYRKFAIGKLSPVLKRVGWTPVANEADTVAILRGELISALGALGDADVISESRRLFAAQANDPNAIPGPLRKVVLGVVARHADAATWEKFRVRARDETVPLVRDQGYVLLSSAQDPALAQRALELAMGNEPGATNTATMVATVAGMHPDLAFDFAVAHREALDERVDFTSRTRYYPSLGAGSSDPAMVGKIRAYAQAYLAEGSRRSAETAIESIQYRIRVQSERLSAINAWLASTGLASR